MEIGNWEKRKKVTPEERGWTQMIEVSGNWKIEIGEWED
jgi:hypothetical protein